jgi:hypothetical protein
MAQTRHSNGASIGYLGGSHSLVQTEERSMEEKRRREGRRKDRKPLIRGRALRVP